MTSEYRKILWGPLRGDGQTYRGGSLVSLRLPGFEKAASSVQRCTLWPVDCRTST